MEHRVIRHDMDGTYQLITWSPSQVPFDVGSLERNALCYLGEWSRLQKEGTPWGFYYRLGIKLGVIDADGDKATAFLHFAVPFVKEGSPMTLDIEQRLSADLEIVVTQSTVLLSRIAGNAIGIQLSPPEYMMRELVAKWL